jgi:hypothetical protein
MSRAIWLLFLNKNSSLEKFFTDINIPFDCEFLVAQPEDGHIVGLTEVYRVSPTLPLQTYRFGNWTPGGGLTWPSKGFYHRRNSLQGLVLKIGTLEDLNDVSTTCGKYSVSNVFMHLKTYNSLLLFNHIKR